MIRLLILLALAGILAWWLRREPMPTADLWREPWGEM